MIRFLLIFVVGWAHGGCASISKEHRTQRVRSFDSFANRIAVERPDLRFFAKSGPFRVQSIEDFSIRVTSNEKLDSDVFFSGHEDSAPLVIIQHGNLADKSVHRNQAIHLASWGMHVLVLSQPNRGRWLKNGEVLGKLVKMLRAWPHILDLKFDPQNIILAGHSFGGSAIAIASGQGAEVAGLIFLDPALVSKQVRRYIERIEVPAVLLGADKSVFRSKQRHQFYKLVDSKIVETSIKNATHNDAQSPSLFSWRQLIGIDPDTSGSRQRLFMAAMATSVFSFVNHKDTSYALEAFSREQRKGRFFATKGK